MVQLLITAYKNQYISSKDADLRIRAHDNVIISVDCNNNESEFFSDIYIAYTLVLQFCVRTVFNNRVTGRYFKVLDDRGGYESVSDPTPHIPFRMDDYICADFFKYPAMIGILSFSCYFFNSEIF